jgi:hypothetical protein
VVEPQRSTWLRLLLLLVLAVTAGSRLAVALADHRSLIALDVYQDDVFYYFRIAQNIVSGRGPTFDGVSATNAFHPLHMLLLLPVMAWSRGDLVAPIHASALLSTLIAVATAWVLWRLMRELAGPITALAALTVWALSPYFNLMGVNGLETGLALLLALSVLALHVSWIKLREGDPGGARAVGLGLLWGLAVLARLDLLLLLVAVACDWLMTAFRRGEPRRAVPCLAVTCALALGVWLPWGMISRITGGTWVASSGAASREIALHYGWRNLWPIWAPERVRRSGGSPFFDPDHVPAAYYADAATKQAFVFLLEQPLLAPLRIGTPFTIWPVLDRFQPYRWFLRSPAAGTALAALLLGAAVAVGLLRSRRPAAEGRTPGRGLGFLLAVYLALTALGYTFYCPAHWYYSRYLVVAELITLIWGLVVLRELLLPLCKRPGWVRLLPALGLALLVAGQLAVLRGSTLSHLLRSRGELGGFLHGWRSLEGHIDRTATIGAFQAGTFSYFGRLDIVNLDGKVNSEARQALADERLHEYIETRGIDVIIDWPWVLESLCVRHMPPGRLRFREIAREPAGGLGFVVYAVERATAG